MTSSHLLGSDALLRRWYANIDAVIDARNRSVAMVVRVVPGPRAESFGTGFFYSKDGWPFFITARHVIDDACSSIQRGEGAFLMVRGRKDVINLSKAEFFCSTDWDVAVMPLWKNGITNCSHIECLTSAEVDMRPEVCLFAFTGFPASKNKTYTNQEIKPNQRVMTFPAHDLESSVQAFPFLTFPMDRKKLHDSALKHTNLKFPQGLAGMSGGPVFAIRGGIDHPTMALFAMGVAWQNGSSLKALRFDLVDAWLSQYFTW